MLLYDKPLDKELHLHCLSLPSLNLVLAYALILSARDWCMSRPGKVNDLAPQKPEISRGPMCFHGSKKDLTLLICFGHFQYYCVDA